MVTFNKLYSKPDLSEQGCLRFVYVRLTLFQSNTVLLIHYPYDMAHMKVICNNVGSVLPRNRVEPTQTDRKQPCPLNSAPNQLARKTQVLMRFDWSTNPNLDLCIIT